jgi:large subunit ribosomal protein L35
MPKVKTHSGAKKRLKLSGSGQVVRKQTKVRHRMSSKTKKSKRNLMKSIMVHPSDQPRMKALLGIM